KEETYISPDINSIGVIWIENDRIYRHIGYRYSKSTTHIQPRSTSRRSVNTLPKVPGMARVCVPGSGQTDENGIGIRWLNSYTSHPIWRQASVYPTPRLTRIHCHPDLPCL